VSVAGEEVFAGSRPVYIIPKARSEDLALERGLIVYDRWPEVRAADRFTIRARFENPLDRAVRIRARIRTDASVQIEEAAAPDGTFEVAPGGGMAFAWPCTLFGRDRGTIPVDIEVAIEGRERPVRDRLTLIIPNMLGVRIDPFEGGGIPVGIRVADRSPFSGTLRIASGQGLDVDAKPIPIDLGSGLDVFRLALPCELSGDEYAIAIEVTDAGGRIVSRASRGFAPGPALTGLRASLGEGDTKVSLEANLSADRGRGGAPCARLTYRFGDGRRYIPIVPEKPEGISGRPASALIWVDGDGSGDALRLRFVDATGQVFQPDGGSVAFKGWRRVEFPMRGALSSWGGAKDGIIHYPIRWDAILLVDSASREAHAGEIRFSQPTLVYEEP